MTDPDEVAGTILSCLTSEWKTAYDIRMELMGMGVKVAGPHVRSVLAYRALKGEVEKRVVSNEPLCSVPKAGRKTEAQWRRRQ